ncbi:lipase family protein [Mesorhizobium sp. M0924]|uniref:hypothetical protein n=1 Tax=unclassified Mesorhizobium TaxID=325217 RepID=UPI0033387E3D
MRLMLVHGRSQGGKVPADLEATWMKTLREGLKKAGLEFPNNVEIDFPFYADRLDDFVKDYELPADPAFMPKGSPVFDEYAAFKAQVVDEMRARLNISDAQVQAEAGDLPAEKGPQNWAWAQAIVRLLDRHLTGVSEGTIEIFLRDVFLYSRKAAVRSAINKIVEKSLSADTTVVVGHSLGSVVAYDVLRNASVKPPLFVTVGCPLGIRAIRSALGTLINPAGTKGWYNAYDTRDVVALYPLDTDNFDVDPAIGNNGKVRNQTSNRHGIIGYLNDQSVAKEIREGFG